MVESKKQDIECLLKKVAHIQEDKSEKQKNPFNSFNIARIGSEETRHSAIIAALLDPQGPLGKGAESLKAFFRQIGLNEIAKFCNAETEVKTEYSIHGRRMDIVITSKPETRFCVVIENKTATTDHELQLEDYRKWLDDDRKAYQYRQLLYLTYEGVDAKNFQGEYDKISYRTHICNWLRECALMLHADTEKAVFCSQYCDFITNTLLGEEMEINKELCSAIASDMKSAIKVCENIDKTKAYLLNTYVTQHFERLGFSVKEKSADDIINARGLDYNVCFNSSSYPFEIELGFDHYFFWGSRILIRFKNLSENDIEKIKNSPDCMSDSCWEISKTENGLTLGKIDNEIRLDNEKFYGLAVDSEREKTIKIILDNYDKRKKYAIEVANEILSFLQQNTKG